MIVALRLSISRGRGRASAGRHDRDVRVDIWFLRMRRVQIQFRFLFMVGFDLPSRHIVHPLAAPSVTNPVTQTFSDKGCLEGCQNSKTALRIQSANIYTVYGSRQSVTPHKSTQSALLCVLIGAWGACHQSAPPHTALRGLIRDNIAPVSLIHHLPPGHAGQCHQKEHQQPPRAPQRPRTQSAQGSTPARVPLGEIAASNAAPSPAASQQVVSPNVDDYEAAIATLSQDEIKQILCRHMSSNQALANDILRREGVATGQQSAASGPPANPSPPALVQEAPKLWLPASNSTSRQSTPAPMPKSTPSPLSLTFIS
ncbi:hypothetical protein QBC35DRAFT_536504 [Podospora australis]|uniref:Uncharacterized protein n=1 Tax=Podospora australis TaxID=1536484 RepID=A0AAN7ACQ3_9PEZI|nr:hypothetical protein QBC35DRAFT_536504 [Podospora australis]